MLTGRLYAYPCGLVNKKTPANSLVWCFLSCNRLFGAWVSHILVENMAFIGHKTLQYRQITIGVKRILPLFA